MAGTGFAFRVPMHLNLRRLGLLSGKAARMFAEFEAGVEKLYPASVAPSRPEFWPLPMPVPTKAKAINALTWKQVLAWGVIIAIATPIALTVAAMVIVAFSLVIGINPQ